VICQKSGLLYNGLRGRTSGDVLWYSSAHIYQTYANNFSADQEKGKYFKIRAPGTAPAASAYSSEDVKRRKLIDERTQALEKEVIRQKGRIRRSILDPLAGGILRREYGRGSVSVEGPRIFANGLIPQGWWREDPPFGAIFNVHPVTDGIVLRMRKSFTSFAFAVPLVCFNDQSSWSRNNSSFAPVIIL
jgi:hypothetical protein